jgi:hypothetical protein
MTVDNTVTAGIDMYLQCNHASLQKYDRTRGYTLVS